MRILVLLCFLVGVIQCGNFNPSTVIPYNMGIAHASATVEAIVPDTQTLQAMYEAGVKWSRCSVHWSTVEAIPGVYNLSLFDQFVPLYTKYNVSLVITLYGNRNATSGSPISQADIQGFVRYVGAILAKYQGHGIIWEMWNEPNGREFWQPLPNATQYAALAVAVGNFMKTNYPDEIFVGPSVSWIGTWTWNGEVGGALEYLKQTIEAGLLSVVDGVSLHAYRGGGPESILYPLGQSWFDTRMVLANYTGWAKLPRLLQTEWGYDTADHAIHNDTTIQAQYLARSYLCDMRQDIAPILWYEWQSETSCGGIYCGMGLIEHREPGQPVVPRPTYVAYQTLATTLAGYTVLQNLTCVDNETYGLAFQFAQKPSQVAIALWNTRPYMHHINCTFIAPSVCFNVVNTFNVSAGKVCSDENSNVVVIANTYDVNYLTPI